MNFLLDPKNYAGFINNTGSAYVMPAAEQYIDKAIVSNPSLKYDPSGGEDDRVREVPRADATKLRTRSGRRSRTPRTGSDARRRRAIPRRARVSRFPRAICPRLEPGLQRVARLDANESRLGPFPAHSRRRRQAIGLGPLSRTRRALLERLAERHGVREGAIVVGQRRRRADRLPATAFLDPGDEAVMGAPSFVSYVQDVLRAGGTAIEVPVRADGALDLVAMAERSTERRGWCSSATRTTRPAECSAAGRSRSCWTRSRRRSWSCSTRRTRSTSTPRDYPDGAALVRAAFERRRAAHVLEAVRPRRTEDRLHGRARRPWSRPSGACGTGTTSPTPPPRGARKPERAW